MQYVILILGFILNYFLFSNSLFLQGWIVCSLLIKIFLQDITTFYISNFWMFASFFLIFLFPPTSLIESITGSLLYLIPCLLMKKICSKWIGNADLFYIGLFGWILGFQRMIICMLISILVGFLFYILFRMRKWIPFVSCLCVGFLIAMWKGYYLFSLLFMLLKG